MLVFVGAGRLNGPPRSGNLPFCSATVSNPQPAEGQIRTAPLHRIPDTPQKKTLRASERDRDDIQAERAVFCEQVRQLDPKELVFIDETGITTAMTRRCARSPRGERAHGSAPGGWRR